eukprot:TRINITY_DN11519_c0_g1_i1.p1 TRINITY_DN11519_c0_g1~~TRINITY_DN11519_c0_g1_i1.p1  ORF type:complete len:102 (-),score=37.46 TRINITY_DN11519_c0_g1_i1:430-735(-)
MLELRIISLGETQFSLFGFGSVMKKGFSFDSAYKPLPNYILTPEDLSNKQKGNTNWVSMNDITATRTPGYMAGNIKLLDEYFKLTKEIMKEKSYKLQYEKA